MNAQGRVVDFGEGIKAIRLYSNPHCPQVLNADALAIAMEARGWYKGGEGRTRYRTLQVGSKYPGIARYSVSHVEFFI